MVCPIYVALGNSAMGNVNLNDDAGINPNMMGQAGMAGGGGGGGMGMGLGMGGEMSQTQQMNPIQQHQYGS